MRSVLQVAEVVVVELFFFLSHLKLNLLFPNLAAVVLVFCLPVYLHVQREYVISTHTVDDITLQICLNH